MKELKEKISDLINEYFDKKIENVDWRYDLSAENGAKRIVAECVSDVMHELDAYDNDLDEHLEDFEYMYTDQGVDDLTLDSYYRQRDLIEEWRKL